MQEIKDELRNIREKVESIDKNVAVNTVSLDNHMRRTEVAERRLEKLETVFISLAVLGVLGGIIKLLIS